MGDKGRKGCLEGRGVQEHHQAGKSLIAYGRKGELINIYWGLLSHNIDKEETKKKLQLKFMAISIRLHQDT